jgi:tetratricopeptide (TPR) repeat protein
MMNLLSMDKREEITKYLKLNNYKKALELVNELLKQEPNDFSTLSNRVLIYLKMREYELSLKDSIILTKQNPNNGKMWGRLGASLYGLDRHEDAILAYHKANELEPKEIYENMINKINKLMTNQESNKNKMNDMYEQLYKTVTSNKTLMEKMNDFEFQDKILSLQDKPFEAMKDKEIMNVVFEMMKSLTS